MPIPPISSHAALPLRARRPDTSAAYGAILGYEAADPQNADVLTALNGLKAYCEQFDLEFSEDAQDAFLSRNALQDWRIFIRTSGLIRIARATQLYMPGKERIYKTGPNLQDHFAEASCYTRFSPNTDQWYEVSRTVCFADYFDRNLEDANLKAPPVLGDWGISPNHKLLEVARGIAAIAALGSYLEAHTYFYATPRSLVHQAFQQSQAG